jgi:tryptophan 2,3-dioxygenase
MISLKPWLAQPNPATFPLDAVIAAFRKTGKHFVKDELLKDLATARATLPAQEQALRRFLDTALDKYDRRFDNPSYLALHDLPLPTTAGQCPLDTSGAERQRDRLITLLIADLFRFEIAAYDGTTDLLPLLRPGPRTIMKRCTLGLRLLHGALTHFGLDATLGGSPIETARELCARIEAEQTAEECRMLSVTMLPVYTAHDEYLFVRVLQCYETTFSLVVAQLRAAIVAAKYGDAARTADALRAAASTMDAATPLFSLVATMQIEAFMIFREYTDGASAIQSRSYKTIESLCRKPGAARLAGPGYDATPEVRERIVAGQPNLSETVAQTPFSPSDLAEIRAAMIAFEAELLGWRKTHYSIAMRMLGMKRGTGYTAGVPYLAAGKDIPVFKCPFA